MPEQWTAKAVGLMHAHKITGGRLAERMGIRREYLSEILNGKRTPKDAELKVMAALDDLIKEQEKR